MTFLAAKQLSTNMLDKLCLNITFKTYNINAKHIIIATGSKPFSLPFFNINLLPIYGLTQIQSMFLGGITVPLVSIAILNPI